MLKDKISFDDIANGMSKHDSFDPKIFNDRVAELCSWDPLTETGVLLTKRKLKSSGFNKLRYTISSANKKILFLTLLVGVILLVFGAYPYLTTFGEIGLKNNLILLSSLLFFIMTGLLLFFILKQDSFDRNKGVFRRKIDKFKLEDFHSLQFLRKQVKLKKIIHACYELNIVFIDGSRIHVMDYNKLEEVEQEAKFLSTFLRIPLWEKK